MLTGIALLAILTMKAWPELPLSRGLHRLLVEMPLERIAKLGRRHLIFVLLVAGLLFAGSEMIMLLGSADLMVVMAWDVSLLVDALIAAWTVAAVVRMKGLATYIRARLRIAPRPRSPRRRRPEAEASPANDSDEDRRRYALAA